MVEQAVGIDEVLERFENANGSFAITPVFIVHENCGFAWDKRHLVEGGREMEWCPLCTLNLRV